MAATSPSALARSPESIAALPEGAGHAALVPAGKLLACAALGEDDPEVFWAWREDVLEWEGTGQSTSDFLVETIYFQAVMGGLDVVGDTVGDEVRQQVVAKVDASWEKVVHSQGVRIWKSPEGVLVSHIDGDAWCIGAARDDKAFAVLEALGFERQ